MEKERAEIVKRMEQDAKRVNEIDLEFHARECRRNTPFVKLSDVEQILKGQEIVDDVQQKILDEEAAKQKKEEEERAKRRRERGPSPPYVYIPRYDMFGDLIE